MASALEMQEAEDCIDRLNEKIAALKAENEEQRERLVQFANAFDAGYAAAERALAERAGGVKVLQAELDWEKRDVWYAKCPVSGKVYLIAEEEGKFWPLWDVSLPGYNTIEAAKAAAQADYERRIMSALTAEPAAPEGQQEEVDAVIISARKLAREYRPSMDKEVLHSWASDVVKVIRVLSTRPSEQAVTEAMVEAAARAMCAPFPPDETIYLGGYYKRWETHMESAALALKAAMEAGR